MKILYNIGGVLFGLGACASVGVFLGINFPGNDDHLIIALLSFGGVLMLISGQPRLRL